MDVAVVGDRTLPYADLDPAYLDRAVFFGDGVYEVLRSYGGRIFALEEHLTRFAHSLAAVGLTEIPVATVRGRVERAFAAAGLDAAKIYFHVTRGAGARDLGGADINTPRFFLTVTALHEDPQEKIQGIRVLTHPDWRWRRCDIKSLNLLANVLARRAAEAADCQEAILVDAEGWVTEGAASAFFAIRRDAGGEAVLQTAPLTANILPSVTRGFVLRAAADLGLAVREASLTPDEARTASELFIGVTTRGIVPVVRCDEAVIEDGRPGPWTVRLIEAFATFTRAGGASLRTGC